VLGSSGLFVLPFRFGGAGGSGWSTLLNTASSGALDGLDALVRPAWRGTPLVWSALLPIGLTGLFYGAPRLRGILAGLGFGMAGALLFAAIAGAFDVRGIPDFLDRGWLALNAAAAALVAATVLRR
jgi:serine protease